MTETQGQTVRDRVERALAQCRPYLQADGGDVELLRVTDDGIVELMFQGTCVVCPMSRMTLRAGLERAILKAAPEVRRVESISSK
jgi:Fe-S cluster biogenesis protein NfuA